MPRMLRLVVSLVALALLAACGGAQSAAPTAPTPPATTLATTGAPPAATSTAIATVVPAETPTRLAVRSPQPSPTPTIVPAARPTQHPATSTATPAPTATQAPAAAPTQSAVLSPPSPATGFPAIALRRVAGGLSNPLYLTHAGDGSGRVFVVEKRGRVVLLRDGAPAEPAFLDITDRVGARANEQGLLSVAFHPRFRENGYLYVNYTDQRGDTVVSRFTAAGDAADAASETVLLAIDQPYANHNGGLVKFGPDGFLYIGMGDGGSGGDPHDNGQNPQVLLGKLLRIDVDGGPPYGIPPDNPGAGGGELAPEVWALGLRNPWRFSFDRATGDLYIADVGQNAIEEVNFAPAGTPGGVNYGWNRLEGSRCFRGRACDPAAFTGPVTEYGHDLGQSITGGYVYRGASFPALQGVYLFADFVSGRIWGLRPRDGAWERAELLDTELYISSFGEDEAGELYLTSMYEGAVYQVVASSQ
ncbi:MAG TPA: PQQ-dependent sugar dehydrogenase [Roseiflexaceae bacterium]|nr:PQQ-dependent sugar dehydrogenase [Roseiflexaceae bacterium]